MSTNKLENIGFYTLCDDRARNASQYSPLWRNEVIITSLCNFKCPYCRGTDINGIQGHMKYANICNILDFFAKEHIQNIRFSGGEPTIHPNIKDIIKYTKKQCTDIKHIAVSSNGFAEMELYKELTSLGVNDWSISLDACCASVGDIMSGGIEGAWNRVVNTITELSKLTYVTVGVVLNENNAKDIVNIIEFASNLGVADVRIISAAQWNSFDIFRDLVIDERILNKHPILKYRFNNFKNGRNVRGICENDSHKCPLILDDMIVKGDYHYPCVIKMREGCSPIGKMSDATVRQDRYEYYKNHDTYCDGVCRQNCLDVCIDYNNKYEEFHKNFI